MAASNQLPFQLGNDEANKSPAKLQGFSLYYITD